MEKQEIITRFIKQARIENYSAGLLLGELLSLKIGYIDSDAMKIHIRQAKGKKDRYIMLSNKTLIRLHDYYQNLDIENTMLA